jgi:hypothetical protein
VSRNFSLINVSISAYRVTGNVHVTSKHVYNASKAVRTVYKYVNVSCTVYSRVQKLEKFSCSMWAFVQFIFIAVGTVPREYLFAEKKSLHCQRNGVRCLKKCLLSL